MPAERAKRSTPAYKRNDPMNAHGQPTLRPPANTLAEHVRRTLALAAPVIVARCGMLVMVTADTIMTGHSGPGELAYLAISFSPHITMLVIGIGLLTGVVVMVAQADGAGRQRSCGQIFWIGLGNAAVLGTFWALVMTQGEAILQLLGQNDDLARGGGRALGMFAWGMPAIYGYVAAAMFLEGIGRTRPGMFVMIGANVVNVGLNWVLIYGNFGFEPMGAAGAVLATSITRWIMLAALLGYVFTMAGRDTYGLFHRIEGPWRLQGRFLRLGAPMALSYSAETMAFMTITMMAGIMGEAQVAGFQATMNVVAFCFMVAIGMSTATSVRVGNAVGRRDPAGMRLAGWTGAGLIAIAMALLAGAVAIWQDPIAAIYTGDGAVRAIIYAGLAVATFLLVVDGLQAVMVGALRGAADVWPTTLIGFFAFWVVMVPAAWLLGPYLGGGVPGLLWGEAIGMVVAAVLLAARFHAISRRHIAPV